MRDGKAIELVPNKYGEGYFPYLYKTRMETDAEFQARLES